MIINFTVHVEYSNGEDTSNKKLFDIHRGFAGTWIEDFTDSNGDVDFELERMKVQRLHSLLVMTTTAIANNDIQVK